MSLAKVYLQIPHYNNSQFLRECFESIDQLNYSHLDIHFFNDQSDDDSIKVLNEISNSNIQIHHNKSRLGRVLNYQNAFSLHKDAEWMINLDSDDYYTDVNWINDAMTIVKDHKEDNICHIQSNLLQFISLSDLNILKEYDYEFYLISGTDYLEICIKHYCFSHLSSIFNVDCLERYGAYTDDCMHTDFFTAMRAAVQGNVLISNKSVGVWRKHDGNQSDMRYSDAESIKNQIAYYQFFEWCEDFLPYKVIKRTIQIFEQRESEKKIKTSADKFGLKGAFHSIHEEKSYNLFGFILVLKSLLGLQSTHLGTITKNISNSILTKGVSALITIISIPFIIKLLSIESYGWVGLYSTIVGALYIFDFGMTNIITKEITQSRIDRKIILGSLELVYFAIGFCIFGLIWLFAPFIVEHWLGFSSLAVENKIKILKLISMAVFFQWPHSFYTGALFGFHRQVMANNWQFIMTLTKNIGAILILKYVQSDIFTFFYWQIAISILTLFIQKYQLSREVNRWNLIPFFSFDYILSIRKLALGISLISIFSFVYTDLNQILLSRWLSLSDFGYYNVLMTIVTAMIMYTASIKNALFPNIASIVRSKSKNEVYSQYSQYLKIISYTLIPVCVLISFNSKELIYFWFGEDSIVYSISSSVPWITLGSLANSLAVIPWAFLIADNRPRFLIWLCGGMAIISMPILYVLIERYGLVGASIYWFIINALPCILLHLFFERQFDSRYKFTHSAILFPMTISSISFWGLSRFQLPFPLLCIMIVLTLNYWILMKLSFTKSKA